MTSSRRLLEWAIPMATTVGTLAVTIAFASDLPDPIATGWTEDGTPHARGSRLRELAVGPIVVAAVALAPIAAANRVAEVGAARTLVVVGHALGTLGLGNRWRVIDVNRQTPRWEEAVDPTSPLTFVALAMVAGLIGWLVSAHRGTAGGPNGERSPTDAGG